MTSVALKSSTLSPTPLPSGLPLLKGVRSIDVNPARKANHYTVTVKAGNVVKDMEGSPAFPAVCGVLGSDMFEKESRIKRLCIDGPVPGSNTLFVFKL